jgi:hypothetical protein
LKGIITVESYIMTPCAHRPRPEADTLSGTLIVRGGDENPHAFRRERGDGNEEIVGHLNVRDVSFEEFKLEAAEHHAQSKVQLRPRQTMAC